MEDRLEQLRRLIPASSAGGVGTSSSSTAVKKTYSEKDFEKVEEGRRLLLDSADKQQQQQQDQSNESTFMKDYFNEIELVSKQLEHINESVDRIETVHINTLKSTNSEETQELNKQMEQLTFAVTAELKSVKKALDAMNANNTKLKKEGKIPAAEQRIRDTCFLQLQSKYGEALKEFQQVQTTSKARYKEKIARQFKIANPSMADAEIVEILERGVTTDVFKQQILDSNHANAKQMYLEAVEKHRDILQIEKSLNELFQMFQDFACIVDEQQDLIDNIQFHVQNASDYVEKAHEEVAQARTYQKKARGKLMIIAGILVAIILLIIFAVVLLPIILKLAL